MSWVTAAVIVAVTSAGTAEAQQLGSADGGVVAQTSAATSQSREGRGTVLFPGSRVFQALIADPRERVFFASMLGGSTPSRGARTGSVGMGASVGIFRWEGETAGEGLQVGLDGGVLAQFDLTKASHDLINADYIIGLPVSYRRGNYSARFRVYHQSSHLGDEFVQNNDVQRLNLSFEALELLVARDFGSFRSYGGGEYRFNRTPHDDLKHGLLHGGVEYRHPGSLFHLGHLGSARPVIALDAQSFEQRDWRVGWSGRIGVELGAFQNGTPGRTVSFLVEVYDGPNPYGQFYLEDVFSVGFGAHFTY